jgi:DNA polymerase-3 subunit gamma/tau
MLAFNFATPSGQHEAPPRPTQLRAVPSPTPQAVPSSTAPSKPASQGADEWATIIARANLQGMVKQLASHCALMGKQGSRVQLKLDAEGEHFRTNAQEEKLTQALSMYYGEPVRLEFSVDTAVDTVARQQKQAVEDRLQQARSAIDSDPNVRAMREVFGASVQPDSVRPIE